MVGLQRALLLSTKGAFKAALEHLSRRPAAETRHSYATVFIGGRKLQTGCHIDREVLAVKGSVNTLMAYSYSLIIGRSVQVNIMEGWDGS